MRSIFFLATFLLFTSSVFAQTLSEQEKRKKLLPYVRSASDCIANSVGNSPKFMEAIEANNIVPLISESIVSCSQPVASMINMHDAIYDGGGMDFFKGPYLADLERAVRNRLANRIASAKENIERVAEQRKALAAKAALERAELEARESATRAAKVANAEKVLDLIRGRTMECIGKQALPMLITDEKAEVIAKAAMIFCDNEVNALVAATYDLILSSGTNPNEQNIRISAKKRVEDVLTAHIVRAKAELMLNSQSNRPKEKSESSSGSTF